MSKVFILITGGEILNSGDIQKYKMRLPPAEVMDTVWNMEDEGDLARDLGYVDSVPLNGVEVDENMMKKAFSALSNAEEDRRYALIIASRGDFPGSNGLGLWVSENGASLKQAPQAFDVRGVSLSI